MSNEHSLDVRWMEPPEPFERAVRDQLDAAGVESPRALTSRALEQLTGGVRSPLHGRASAPLR